MKGDLKRTGCFFYRACMHAFAPRIHEWVLGIGKNTWASSLIQLGMCMYVISENSVLILHHCWNHAWLNLYAGGVVERNII